jgi:hypothetical protein
LLVDDVVSWHRSEARRCTDRERAPKHLIVADKLSRAEAELRALGRDGEIVF